MGQAEHSHYMSRMPINLRFRGLSSVCNWRGIYGDLWYGSRLDGYFSLQWTCVLTLQKRILHVLCVGTCFYICGWDRCDCREICKKGSTKESNIWGFDCTAWWRVSTLVTSCVLLIEFTSKRRNLCFVSFFSLFTDIPCPFKWNRLFVLVHIILEVGIDKFYLQESNNWCWSVFTKSGCDIHLCY